MQEAAEDDLFELQADRVASKRILEKYLRPFWKSKGLNPSIERSPTGCRKFYLGDIVFSVLKHLRQGYDIPNVKVRLNLLLSVCLF